MSELPGTRQRSGFAGAGWVRWAGALALAVVLSPAQSQQQADAGTAPIGQTTSLLDVRQMHGAAVLGDYLYVVGGDTGKEGYAKSAEMAKIQPSGLLGEWSSTTPLPTPRCYVSNSTVVLNDTIYVVGGFDNKVVGARNPDGGNSKTAYWTRPLADGQLGPWQESPPIPGEGISCMSVVTTPGHLYVLGGLTNANVPTANVFMGTVGPEGGIVQWDPAPPLPVALWFHHAVAVGGRVWVWGGLTGSNNKTTTAKVYSAPILSGGILGAWREESDPLPVPYYSAANASAGPYIMAFCPRLTGGTNTTDVWFSSAREGTLTPWMRFTTNLTASRFVTTASDYRRGNIYIPGGRQPGTGNDLENRVYYLTLAAEARKSEPEATKTAQTTTAIQDAGKVTARPGYTFDAAASLPANAIPGFLPYDEARRVAAGPPGKPLLLYFNLPGIRQCEEQNQILRDPQFAALANQAVFAWIHVQEYPQLVSQLGVFRVPTWVLYDSRSASRGKVTGKLTLDQLQAGVASAQ